MLQHGLLERAPSSSLPPALSYIARKRVHMHVDIWAHMSTSVHTVCRSCPWPSSGPMSAQANSLVYPQEDTVVKKRPLQAWKQFGKAIPEAREPEIRSREGAQLSLGVSLWSCWLLMLWRGMWLGPRVHGSPGWHQWCLGGGQEFYLRWSKMVEALGVFKIHKRMTFI